MKKNSGLKGLRILPKVSAMAEAIDTKEAAQKAEDILANASYEEAYAIMAEAADLLKALLKRNKSTRMAKEGRTGLSVIADKGKEIGELALALKTINTYII